MNVRIMFWRTLQRLRQRPFSGWKVGDFFPSFSLKDLAGVLHRISFPTDADFTVLWFTNLCDDCRERAGLLDEISRETSDRFSVAAVSLLSEPETRRLAGPWEFPILLDPEDVVAKRLRLPHPPATCPLNNLFFLDKTGRIVFRHHLSALKPDEFRSKWRGFVVDRRKEPTR